MHVHTLEKNHVCYGCDRAFALSHHLKCHIKTTSDKKAMEQGTEILVGN